jgi:hypothetical protein
LLCLFGEQENAGGGLVVVNLMELKQAPVVQFLKDRAAAEKVEIFPAPTPTRRWTWD